MLVVDGVMDGWTARRRLPPARPECALFVCLRRRSSRSHGRLEQHERTIEGDAVAAGERRRVAHGEGLIRRRAGGGALVLGAKSSALDDVLFVLLSGVGGDKWRFACLHNRPKG